MFIWVSVLSLRKLLFWWQWIKFHTVPQSLCFFLIYPLCACFTSRSLGRLHHIFMWFFRVEIHLHGRNTFAWWEHIAHASFISVLQKEWSPSHLDSPEKIRIQWENLKPKQSSCGRQSWSEGRWRWQRCIKMRCVHAPTSHTKGNHYVSQTCTRTIRNLKWV